MTRFLFSRLIGALVVLMVKSFVIFALIGLMPGDPINMMIAGDPRMTSEDAARLRALYELDKPLLQRYLAWAWQALHGNFGYSRSFGQPVLAVLGPRLANTLQLAGLAFLISTAIALPLGMWAAHRPRSRTDYLINQFCFAGISMPPFWLALLLITLFAVTLGWLPAGGMADLRAGTSSLDALGQTLRHLVLPASTLGLLLSGVFANALRLNLRRALDSDYVEAARSRGLSERRVVLRHALPNALLPVLTITGITVASLIGGALLIEVTYSWPGVAFKLQEAISQRDYPVVQGIVVVVAALVVAVSVLVDLLVALLDPRISF